MTDILDTRAGFDHFERVVVPPWATGAGSAGYLACWDRALEALVQAAEGDEPCATSVEVHCRIHRNVAPGDALDAGLRVVELGTASVRFEAGLFHPGEHKPAASGRLAVVIVDHHSGKPAPLPPALRIRLEAMRG